MEEEIDIKNAIKQERVIYWSASEVFSILSEKEFRDLVMPFIKAYYKHQYGNELYLQEHDIIDVSIIIHVDRVLSKIIFYHEPNDYTSTLESELKNDRNDLTCENIFDFIYYEYRLLFNTDPPIDEPEKKKEIKKTKITL